MPIRLGAACALLAAFILCFAAPARADDDDSEKIALCHAGLIKFASFEKHLKAVREARRYEPEEIEALTARHRKYGADYLTSQILIQDGVTGSGTFSLRLYHGISTAATYRNVTAWDCMREDYPIVYFVGYRVRKIAKNTIFVSREKDVVNVISLSARDPKFEKHLKVQIFEGDKVLCEDLGAKCAPEIFYERQE